MSLGPVAFAVAFGDVLRTVPLQVTCDPTFIVGVCWQGSRGIGQGLLRQPFTFLSAWWPSHTSQPILFYSRYPGCKRWGPIIVDVLLLIIFQLSLLFDGFLRGVLNSGGQITFYFALWVMKQGFQECLQFSGIPQLSRDRKHGCLVRLLAL